MSICDTFRNQSFTTWDALGRGATVGMQLSEETLTELNLLEFRTRHPREIVTYSYSKPKEASTGADWEWWLTGRSGRWLGLRIQAKVLDHSTQSYRHLHYQPRGQPLSQCETLISTALSASPRRIPLYCLYSHLPPSSPSPTWRCGTFGTAKESYGCSIVSAVQVLHLQRHGRQTGLGSLTGVMWPWHCIVCCRGFADGDLPERALAYWRASIHEADSALEAPEIQIDNVNFREPLDAVGVADLPPDYVLAILEGNRPEAREDSPDYVMVLRESV